MEKNLSKVAKQREAETRKQSERDSKTERNRDRCTGPENTSVLAKGEVGWRRDGLSIWDQQMQTITYRMDKQHGPTVQHRELYLISYNNP